VKVRLKGSGVLLKERTTAQLNVKLSSRKIFPWRLEIDCRCVSVSLRIYNKGCQFNSEGVF